MKHKKISFSKIIISALMALYALINFYPLIYMLFMSLKDNAEITVTNPFGLPSQWLFENYAIAWSKFNIPMYTFNSAIISLVSVTCVVVFSLMFSYAVSRMIWKGSSLCLNFILLGIFIPMQIVLIPLVILVRDLHMSNSYMSLIFPYIGFELAFCCMIFASFMKTIPFELEEAAYIDGAGIFKTFFSIICPLMKPSIVAGVIYVFIGVWNEFMLALVMITDETKKTLPIGLVSFTGKVSSDWGGIGAVMVLSSIPTVLLYLCMGEKLEQALSVGSAVKG